MKTLIQTSMIMATVMVSANLAFADPVHAKTETEIVGYRVTTSEVPSNEHYFRQMDKNGDNLVNFKEFQAKAQLDNEYGTFIEIDRNGDKFIDLAEYGAFDKTKGQKVTESNGEDRMESKGEEVVFVTETQFVPVRTYNFNQNR